VPALTVAAGAGFTTTSSLLSWLLYGLVAYDGTQARLLQELVDHDFTDDTEVTPELLEDLPELDKFIKEMQRRHNPSYQPGRTAQRDLILPGGYKVKKGTVIIVALHHIHMNPKIWFVSLLRGSMPLKHPTNTNTAGTTPKSSTQTDGTQKK
jgi:cytochrome P450